MPDIVEENGVKEEEMNSHGYGQVYDEQNNFLDWV